MDAAKTAKSLFLLFQYDIYFKVNATDSQLLWLLRINQTLPGDET
jgi:hypothetical protein